MRAIFYLLLIFILMPLSVDANPDSLTFASFHAAKVKLENMLTGKGEISYEEAIYEIENAWWGGGLDHNSYAEIINFHVKNISNLYEDMKDGSLMDAGKDLFEIRADKEENYQRALMNYAIYSYITKPGIIIWPDKKLYKYQEFTYAANDPFGTYNWKNTQVTNLLNNKVGNCFALASLFKIFSERLNSLANLCTAPGHVYIRHSDNHGTKFNVELANGSFPGIGTIETLTHTPSQATKNGIALRELDLEKSIALCLVYLAKGYEYKFGINDDDFILSCAESALRFDDHNLNAMLLKAEVLESRLMKENGRFELLSKTELFREYQQLITHIFELGYREMPFEMKMRLVGKAGRDSISAANSTRYIPRRIANNHLTDTRYASLSNGMFDEEINTKKEERYNNTIFNTASRKIVAFSKKELLDNNYNFDVVIFALSVDPLSYKFAHATPYNFVENNPISRIDPDGADWILSTGNRVYWYGGHYGDRKNLLAVYKATSGMDKAQAKTTFQGVSKIVTMNVQQAQYQKYASVGPTPEGKYKINLTPDPERTAEVDTKTGELKRSPEGGIEKIPRWVENPQKPGLGWTYSDWGENRARLEPVNVTGATPQDRDLNSFYFHDSKKGYSHGCTECETELFKKLKEYREAGNGEIEVKVQYPNPQHKTNGGTKKVK
ncbi:hypothetical protein SAMN05428949_6460 [Chitinophaga sp. YR627]|uniref:hypothetical protein n=1 Tax=Chitinophaga sp. YR627 TaxID=1881041 RepID=UPI0008F09D6A|nr:hypothetical protein [Chitinophaga sp. YR627]SFO74875.1 hypothetical protein SAMN05428949_6460 [Chitinophaga sp. YR627]